MTTTATTTRMRAVVQHHYGTADTLATGEIDRPTAGPRQVLVEVRAAGVDRGAVHLMTGLPYAVRLAGYGVRAPKDPVRGREAAGTVTAVGDGVTRFRPGDEVFGVVEGAFAEYAVGEEDKLAPKPASLSFEEAAAVPISGLTALQALTDVGRLEAGQRVLVVGASGGVGSFAVQIATALGARVTGVSSGAKADLVRSLGAAQVIDHAREDFAASGERHDLVLDIGGNSSLRRLRRALTPDGTLVIVGGEEGGRWFGGIDRQLRALLLSPLIGQRLTSFIAKEDHTGLERLAALAGSGQLRPAIERTYELADVPEAMHHVADGRVRGKVVISI